MPCNCPYAADECDGEHATHYQLQDGGMCAVEKCRAPNRDLTHGDMEHPPLPPTRMYHRGAKVDQHGRVSALCFSKPRPIDMKRASWTLSDSGVTCPKCKAMILARGKTPNA